MTDFHLPTTPAPVPAPPAPEGKGHPLRLAVLGGLVVLAGLAGGWSLLAMIVALIVMIFLHELGHYLTAKWAGMKVTEFFIGFGPRIWSTRRGETEYGIKAIPAGAYVKIIGMHNLDEFDEGDYERTYMSKPFWRRLSVAVAGSTMHFLLALVCFFFAFGVVGLPGGALPFDEEDEAAIRASAPWVVDLVSPDSAAEQAGLQIGDRVVELDGVAVETFGEFRTLVEERPGETVSVLIERDGSRQAVETTLGERDGRGFFGVGPRLLDQTVGVTAAVGDTVEAFGRTMSETFAGLGHILSPSGLADLGRDAFSADRGEPAVDAGTAPASDGGGGSEPQAAGIIRISDVGAGLLDAGEFGYFLAVFATINIFIGVFNLVPLLPLDGGHVAIAVYERIRSIGRDRPYHVDVVKLLPITYATVVVLGFLMLSVVVLDTRTLVGS